MAATMPKKLLRALEGTADPARAQAFGAVQLLPPDPRQTYQRVARNAVRVASSAWKGDATITYAAGGFWVVTPGELTVVRRYPNATQHWDVVLTAPLTCLEAVAGGNALRPTLTLLTAAEGKPLMRLGFPLFSKKRDAALALINIGA